MGKHVAGSGASNGMPVGDPQKPGASSDAGALLVCRGRERPVDVCDVPCLVAACPQ
jgi:hypothetical protein